MNSIKPSHYHIIAVGKIKRSWIKEGLNQYLKRLPGLKITELKDECLTKEEKSIRATLLKNEILITLAEEGDLMTSCDFANRLKEFGSAHLAFVIGGADGLTPEIKLSAKWQFSLSPLTLPHELARLILIEQIYRAQSILQGGPYHRGDRQ